MSFERCLRLAKAATPSLLDKAQRLLFARLISANLPSAQVGVVLKTLAEHTEAGVLDLKRDWRAFEQLERVAEAQEQREIRGNSSPYVVINGALHYERDSRDGIVQSPLCNFDAHRARKSAR